MKTYLVTSSIYKTLVRAKSKEEARRIVPKELLCGKVVIVEARTGTNLLDLIMGRDNSENFNSVRQNN